MGLQPPPVGIVQSADSQMPRGLTRFDQHFRPGTFPLERHLIPNRAPGSGLTRPGAKPARRALGLRDTCPHILDGRAERSDNHEVETFCGPDELSAWSGLHAVLSLGIVREPRRSRRVQYTSVSSA